MNIQNEKGSALILVLVMLVCVTLLGITSMNSSEFESRILNNFKNHEITFHLNDGSVAATAKMIHHQINKDDTFVLPVQYMIGGDADPVQALNDFNGRVKNFSGLTDAPVDIMFNYGKETGDIDMNVDVNVEIDFAWRHIQAVAGSSVEFMQYVGHGNKARIETIYSMTGTGTGKNSSRSEIDVFFSDVQ